MIRFLRLPTQALHNWLVDQELVRSGHARYRLRLWHEDRASLGPLQNELIAYIQEALDDARTKIRAGFEDDLSPFDDPAHDPAANYPAMLHRMTLQGYLGETLAVLAVEHWGAHGHDDWLVPALLFRFHEQEFQHLEAINERLMAGEVYGPDNVRERRPGRTGDDALAFRRNAEGIIIAVLTLEAKCLTDHKAEKVADAHEKLSSGGARPAGIRELINLLDDYDTPEALEWQQSLLEFWRGGYRNARRYDGVLYACTNAPRRAGVVAWLPVQQPHPAYTPQRSLEAMEFKLDDLNAIIDIIYRRA